MQQQLADEFTHPITIYHSDSKTLIGQQWNALMEKYGAGKYCSDFFHHISLRDYVHPVNTLNCLLDLEVFLYRSLKDSLATLYTHELIDQLNALAVHQKIFIAQHKEVSYTFSRDLNSVERHEAFKNEQLIAAAARLFHISRLKIAPNVIFIDGIESLKKSKYKWELFINRFIPILERISTETPYLKIVMWMHTHECEAVYEAFNLKDRIKVPCLLEAPAVGALLTSALTDTEIRALFNQGVGDSLTDGLRCIANAAARRAVEDFIKTKFIRNRQ